MIIRPPAMNARWLAILAVVLVASSCGQSSATTTSSPSATSATNTAVAGKATVGSTSSTSIPSIKGTTVSVITPDQVESRLRELNMASVVLMPVAIPSDWKIELTTRPAGYALSYTDPKAARSITLQIAIPNPPNADTDQGPQSFRGDPQADYRALVAADPRTTRLLKWWEPGTWTDTPPPEGLGVHTGIPYYLTSEGLSDAGFWSIANSLVAIGRSTSTAPASFEAFAGSWWVHTIRLDVHGNTAVATYPIHNWCSSSPPPCDEMVDNQIIDGGHATIRLDRVDTDGVAHGTVVATTDTDNLAFGPVVLVRVPGDHLILAGVGGPPWGPLCSPSSPVETCGA